jgi:hypothetical protein
MQIADLTTKRRLADTLTDSVIMSDEKECFSMLVYLLALYSGRTLVFLNAISGIRRVCALLKLLGIPAQVCSWTVLTSCSMTLQTGCLLCLWVAQCLHHAWAP